MFDATGDIEVGHVADPNVEGGGGLRLWRVREALRQSELRLAAQAAALTTIESRAQGLAGWLISVLTVLIGAFLVPSLPPAMRVAAGSAALTAGGALAFVALTLRPNDWTVAGHNPSVLMESTNSAELYDLEAMSLPYAKGIAANSGRLATASAHLRHALLVALCAPITALVAGALTWVVAATAVPT